METRTTTNYVSNTQKVKFGYWKNDGDEFVEVTFDNLNDVAEVLAVSPQLLEAIVTSFECLADTVHSDLVDIWKKL